MTDFDLDDELLQLAGGGKPGGGFKGRRRSAALSSSSSDDERGYAKSDDDDEGEERRGAGSDGGRTKGSRMPLKKRLDMGEKDEEGGSRGERGEGGDDDGYESSELSFGESGSLYKDDEDRKALALMTELKREMILAERAEQRRDKVLEARRRRKVAQAHEREASSRRTSGGESRDWDRVRDVDRPLALRVRSTKDRSKEDALETLVSLQARKSGASTGGDTTERKRQMEAVAMGRGGTPAKSSYSPSSLSSSPSSPSPSEEEGEEAEDGTDDEEAEGGIKKSRGGEAGIDDLKQIFVTRQQLEKWFMEPFFEESMIGVLVRLGVGSHHGQNVYRVCEVVGIDARDRLKVYDFAGRKTYKYLDCKWGEARGRWAMYMVSNSPPTEREFKHWFDELKRLGLQRVSKDVVMERIDGLHKARKYVYTPDVVKSMLAEKRQMQGWRVRNAPLEKERLKKLLNLAQQAGDDEEAAHVKEQLKNLEMQALQMNNSDAKAVALALINKKNQEDNYRAALETTLVADGTSGEANYDPFSRRWTRSNNYIKARPLEEDAEKKEKETEAEAEAAKGEDNEEQSVVPMAAPPPLDGGSILLRAHDFDLPISLERIQAFGGAQGAAKAFMARKRLMETKFGVQGGQRDDRTHTLTLTVHDYKRRRGLL